MVYALFVFYVWLRGLKVLSFEFVKCKMLFWQAGQLAVDIAVTVTVTMTERQVTATSDNMWGEVSSFQFPFAHNIPYPGIYPIYILKFLCSCSWSSTLTSTRYYPYYYSYYLSCPSLPSWLWRLLLLPFLPIAPFLLFFFNTRNRLLLDLGFTPVSSFCATLAFFVINS